MPDVTVNYDTFPNFTGFLGTFLYNCRPCISPKVFYIHQTFTNYVYDKYTYF